MNFDVITPVMHLTVDEYDVALQVQQANDVLVLPTASFAGSALCRHHVLPFKAEVVQLALSCYAILRQT